MWDNLQAGRNAHFFKTASENGDHHSPLGFLPWIKRESSDEAIRVYLSYSVRLLKTTFRHWLEDKAPQLGAALAYYTVFSLAPMILVLLAVFGLIYGNSEIARREILHQLYSFLDRSSAKPSIELQQESKSVAVGRNSAVIPPVHVLVRFQHITNFMNQLLWIDWLC